MYSFGTTSKKRLEECHQDLQKIMNEAIKRSYIDFSITEGYRSLERQNELYRQGRSKIDGINKKGKHNLSPSHAVDICVYHPNYDTRKKLVYDVGSLCFIAGVIQTVAKELYEKGEVSHIIRWGGNWDNDGVILHDQSFDDLPHFELKKP